MSNWQTSESAIGIGGKNGRYNQQGKEFLAEAVYEGSPGPGSSDRARGRSVRLTAGIHSWIGCINLGHATGSARGSLHPPLRGIQSGKGVVGRLDEEQPGCAGGLVRE